MVTLRGMTTALWSQEIIQYNQEEYTRTHGDAWKKNPVPTTKSVLPVPVESEHNFTAIALNARTVEGRADMVKTSGAADFSDLKAQMKY